MNRLILATGKGVVICERDHQEWKETSRGLTDQHVTSIIAREDVILAGTEDGIFRSDDEGQTWQDASDGLFARHIRWMAFHPDISDFEFAGTEPANIFVSRNGGRLWS